MKSLTSVNENGGETIGVLPKIIKLILELLVNLTHRRINI